MISMLVSNPNDDENAGLVDKVEDIIAKNTDEQLQIMDTTKIEDVPETIKELDKLDAAMIDVTSDDGIGVAKNVRGEHPSTEMMIIADATISPMRYLNPEIRAASLLLRPLNDELVSTTMNGFLKPFFQEEAAENFFQVERRGELIRVPYNKIFYFEARNKKIYARLNSVEYAIYDTIDHLCEILPEGFVRCHRSYIVNHEYISMVKYADNLVVMRDDIMVPLSRSYKPALKAVMGGRDE